MRREKVMHFSHNHPLREFKVKEDDGLVCSGCEIELSGPAFKCIDSDCNFYLHKSCIDLPQKIRHLSHPAHVLSLHSAPVGNYGEFSCNACGETGSAFTYHCSICDYDLHVKCSSLPETVTRGDHEHPLILKYSIQNNAVHFEIVCDVCDDSVKDGCWVYYCIDCDFGTHLDCVNVGVHIIAKEADKEEEEEEEEEGENGGNSGSSNPMASSYALMEAQIRGQQQMHRMQLELQASRQQAQFMIDMGRSMANLAG